MNKKTREKIEKKAAETVKARHAGDISATVGKVSAVLQAKPKPEPKVSATSSLPALPKLPSVARLRKDKPVKPCACGNCGQVTKSMWAPGHDAYCKGWALRVEREICKMSDVPKEVIAGVRIVMADRKKVAEANPHKAAPKMRVVKAKEEVKEEEANVEETADPAVGE